MKKAIIITGILVGLLLIVIVVLLIFTPSRDETPSTYEFVEGRSGTRSGVVAYEPSAVDPFFGEPGTVSGQNFSEIGIEKVGVQKQAPSFASSNQNIISNISSFFNFSNLFNFSPTVSTQVVEATLTLQTTNGPLTVANFLIDPDVEEHEGYYVFEGPLNEVHIDPAELPENAFVIPPGPLYSISYIPESSYFIITLLGEPLQTVRFQAVQDMANRLGVSLASLCSLNSDVSVPRFVNADYAGFDLGIPSCPGAYNL